MDKKQIQELLQRNGLAFNETWGCYMRNKAQYGYIFKLEENVVRVFKVTGGTLSLNDKGKEVSLKTFKPHNYGLVIPRLVQLTQPSVASKARVNKNLNLNNLQADLSLDNGDSAYPQ